MQDSSCTAANRMLAMICNIAFLAPLLQDQLHAAAQPPSLRLKAVSKAPHPYIMQQANTKHCNLMSSELAHTLASAGYQS